MTGQPFTLLVDIPLKTGRADEFMALLNDVFEAMKVEETFVSATALRDTEDPDTILLCENWIDRENFMSVQLKRPYRDRYEARLPASPLAPQIVFLRADPLRPIAVVAKGGVPPTISNGTSARGTRRTLSGRMTGNTEVVPGQKSASRKSPLISAKPVCGQPIDVDSSVAVLQEFTGFLDVCLAGRIVSRETEILPVPV